MIFVHGVVMTTFYYYSVWRQESWPFSPGWTANIPKMDPREYAYGQALYLSNNILNYLDTVHKIYWHFFPFFNTSSFDSHFWLVFIAAIYQTCYFNLERSPWILMFLNRMTAECKSMNVRTGPHTFLAGAIKPYSNQGSQTTPTT